MVNIIKGLKHNDVQCKDALKIKFRIETLVDYYTLFSVSYTDVLFKYTAETNNSILK